MECVCVCLPALAGWLVGEAVVEDAGEAAAAVVVCSAVVVLVVVAVAVVFAVAVVYVALGIGFGV